MKVIVPILSVLFSALKAIAIAIASPLTVLCCVGLLVFTYKIARDLNRVPRDPMAPDVPSNAGPIEIPPLAILGLRA